MQQRRWPELVVVVVVVVNDRGSKDGVPVVAVAAAVVVEEAPRGSRQKLKQWYQGTRRSYGLPSGTAFCKRSSRSDGQGHFKCHGNEYEFKASLNI